MVLKSAASAGLVASLLLGLLQNAHGQVSDLEDILDELPDNVELVENHHNHVVTFTSVDLFHDKDPAPSVAGVTHEYQGGVPILGEVMLKSPIPRSVVKTEFDQRAPMSFRCDVVSIIGDGAEFLLAGEGCEPGRVPCGQEQDRNPMPACCQLLGDLETVEIGQHHVEHDEMRGRSAGRFQGLSSGGRDRDIEALVAQGHGDEIGDVGFVVDDEHSAFVTHAPQYRWDSWEFPERSLKTSRVLPETCRRGSVGRLSASAVPRLSFV
jgi:hypothetical protein